MHLHEPTRLLKPLLIHPPLTLPQDQYKQCAEDLRSSITAALKLFAVRYAVLVRPRKPEHNNMFAKGGMMCGTVTKGRNIKNDRWQLMPGMSQKDEVAYHHFSSSWYMTHYVTPPFSPII